jgi:small conductance mechanosensitive channel
MPRRLIYPLVWLAVFLALFASVPARAAEDPYSQIVMDGSGPTDGEIENRIAEIFEQIGPLQEVEVSVEAGVVGLADGFAVRDTLENFVSSVMLSVRQPFRPNDHVVIGDHEGRVVRLTSRATILLTLQGNHLRIPNSTVFKSVILNYTRVPQRRFDFKLGIDAKDDPMAAIDTGLAAIAGLPFVLDDPAPSGHIDAVGDCNIVIFFAAWIDQNASDYAKSRSVAIAATKNALEASGFALPEPLYRLRFDGHPAEVAAVSAIPATVEQEKTAPEKPAEAAHAAEDVTPDTHIADQVAEERSEGNTEDLLNYHAPTE